MSSGKVVVGGGGEEASLAQHQFTELCKDKRKQNGNTPTNATVWTVWPSMSSTHPLCIIMLNNSCRNHHVTQQSFIIKIIVSRENNTNQNYKRIKKKKTGVKF